MPGLFSKDPFTGVLCGADGVATLDGFAHKLASGQQSSSLQKRTNFFKDDGNKMVEKLQHFIHKLTVAFL